MKNATIGRMRMLQRNEQQMVMYTRAQTNTQKTTKVLQARTAHWRLSLLNIHKTHEECHHRTNKRPAEQTQGVAQIQSTVEENAHQSADEESDAPQCKHMSMKMLQSQY